jgi:hypothetical protein
MSTQSSREFPASPAAAVVAPSPVTVIHVYGPISGSACLPHTRFISSGPFDSVPEISFGSSVPLLDPEDDEPYSSLGCDPDHPVRVWPSAADADVHGSEPVCADAALALHPAIGMNAADWFNVDWGRYPCRRWKSYAVAPSREVKFFPTRDDFDADPAEVSVMERDEASAWQVRETFLLPGGQWGGGEARYFLPEGGEVRIDVPPSAQARLKVCQRAE